MASIYVRHRKYWLRYWDPETDSWRAKTTPLHYPEDARKAKQLRLETTAAEARKRAQMGQRARQDERFASWVSDHFRTRYGKTKTGNRYLNSWTHLQTFMDPRGIFAPSAWRAHHNAGYVDWKEEQGYCREGAIWDLGTLSLVMNEAKARGFVYTNLVSKRKIRRGKRAKKPALTHEQIFAIRKKLEERIADENRPAVDREAADELLVAFEISLGTGCRIAETSIPLHRIDLERGAITFLPKGGEMYTVEVIFPSVLEYLRKLVDRRRAEGRNETCRFTTSTSAQFSKLCRRLKLKGPDGEKITFHCLRVNFITRCILAGIDGEAVRRLVHHGDALINRLYQRYVIGDLRELASKYQIQIPVVGLPEPVVASTGKQSPAQPSGHISSAKPKPPSRAVSRRPGADLPRATASKSGKNSPAPRPVP